VSEVSDVKTWAKEYRARGFALARIEPGQKLPSYEGWTLRGFPPDRFRETDSIGILGGRLSGDLVCVDIDNYDALTVADEYLPLTQMIEGRPHKPRSHRWFRVVNVPQDLTAPSHAAGGMGGPWTKRLRRPKGKVIVEFIGTGAQAVVPPSVWRKNGEQEGRVWDVFGEPAVVDCRELYEATCRLAAAFGWVDKTTCPRAKNKAPRELEADALLLPMPKHAAVRQALRFLSKVSPAVEGQGGSMHTYGVACSLVIEFGLTPEEALPLLLVWNRKCSPPWSIRDLQYKLQMANSLERPNRGSWVQPEKNVVRVSLLTGEPTVFVGVDVAAEGRSFVDLSPSLYAGMLKVGEAWRLSPEMAEVSWQERKVLLAPPSTIATNKKEVWGEFFLARLLREHGAAEVKGLRLPSLGGRRTTLGMVPEADCVIGEPPRNARDAFDAAARASQEGRRLARYRRSLPRKKPSPKLALAIEYVKEHDVRALTKDEIRKAKEKSISKATLNRAIHLSYS
jgi:hypothetical protein